MSIFGVTPKQQLAAGVVAVLGVVAAVSAAAGQWRLAGALVAVLLSAAVLVGLDVRRRAGDVIRHLRRVSASTEAQITRVGRELGDEIREGRDTGVGPELTKQVSGLVKKQTQEVEALLQLYRGIDPQAPMPPSGQWALNPRGLLNLYMLARRERPQVVVELGSGTSTVWLGYALAANNQGRVVSLDHAKQYAELTAATVAQHQEAMAPVEVRHAPLVPLELGSDTYRWYDVSVLADIDKIDLLIVDGPPKKTGSLARYPALPALFDRLSDGAVVVLDDAGRADEKKIIQRWIGETPGLVRESTSVGRQAVLRYSRGGRGV